MTKSLNEVRPRNCEHCGDVFQPLSDRAKYCTTSCQLGAARRRKRERDRAYKLGIKLEPEKSFEEYLQEQASKSTPQG